MKKLNESTKAYSLIGVDGNAFSVMGYVAKAMRECHKSKEEIDAYYKDAMSGDYNNLLCVSMDMLEILNNANGYRAGHQYTKPDPNEWENQEPSMLEESEDWDDEDGEYQEAQRKAEADVRVLVKEYDPEDLRRDPDFYASEIANRIFDEYHNLPEGAYIEILARDMIEDFLNGVDIDELYESIKETPNKDSLKSINEDYDFPKWDEINVDDDIPAIELDDDFRHTKLLEEINKNDECLYMTDNDFKTVGITLENILDALHGHMLDVIICNEQNLQVVIGRHNLYNFYNKFNKDLKAKCGISVLDLKPFIYNEADMNMIVHQFDKKYFGH